MLLHSLLAILLYGLLNRVRGSHPRLKPYVYAAMALVIPWLLDEITQPVTTTLVFVYLLNFVGIWIGFMPGWGKYFPRAADTSGEREVPIVDWLADRLYLRYTDTTPPAQAIRWKTLAMGLRFLLFFWPKYIVLAVLLRASLADLLLIALLAAAMLLYVGFIYRWAFARHNGPDVLVWAEIATGMWLGALDILFVWAVVWLNSA